MAVFVLVHGAWGGAHGFRKVRGPLREAGHEVFTPSLTGIGGAGGGYGTPRLGRDWLVPPLPREFDDPAEAAWADPRRTPHPAGCFTEPVRLHMIYTGPASVLRGRDVVWGQARWAAGARSGQETVTSSEAAEPCRQSTKIL